MSQQPPDPAGGHQPLGSREPDAPADRPASTWLSYVLVSGFWALLLGLISSVFVSLRLTVVVTAGITGVVLVALVWPVMSRPTARACCVVGTAALVAGAGAICFRLPGGVIPPAGLFSAGVLGWLAGFGFAAVARRRAPQPQPPGEGSARLEADLTAAAGTVLLLVGVYLLAVGLVAWFTGAHRAGALAVAVALNVGVLGLAVLNGRGQPWYRRLLLVVVAVAATLGVEGVFVGRYRLGGAVALYAALAVWTVYRARRRGPVGRVGAPVLVLLIALSIGAFVRRDTAAIGVLGLSASLAALLYLAQYGRLVRDHSARLRPVAAALAFVAAVAVVAAGLGALGIRVRASPEYVKRYGMLVTVSVLDTCTSRVSVGGPESAVTCPSVVWSVNGEVGVATLVGTVDELDRGGFHVDRVDAYVLGDRAYTPRIASGDDRFAPLGRMVPPWLAFALPFAPTAFVLLVWRRPRRPAAPPPAPAATPVEPSPPVDLRTPDHVALKDIVVEGLRLAAVERTTDAPLTTGQVLAALARVDIHAGWERIWLYTGDPAGTGLAGVPDPPLAGPPAQWQGIPVSPRVARAFFLLDRLCFEYPLLYPAGSGAMTLALVADASNGAARTLLRSGGLTHTQLLRAVQDNLVNTTLPHLGALIPAADW